MVTTKPAASAIIAERSGAIQLIEFNRPEKKNAVTFAMYDALTAAINQAERDPAIRVMLFHGRGDSFTAGNDLGDFARNPPTSADTPSVRFFQAISQATKPIVAAVQGHAIGGGTTMLFHCDLVYASPDAQFLLPFVSLGLVPEGASSYLLPRTAGYQRAAAAILLGVPLDAAAMHQLGLVTGILPLETLLAGATAAAQTLSEKPAESVRAAKRLMKQPTAQTVAAAIQAEAQEFIVRLQSPDAKEAFAAFMQKRQPQFNHSGNGRATTDATPHKAPAKASVA